VSRWDWPAFLRACTVSRAMVDWPRGCPFPRAAAGFVRAACWVRGPAGGPAAQRRRGVLDAGTREPMMGKPGEVLPRGWRRGYAIMRAPLPTVRLAAFIPSGVPRPLVRPGRDDARRK
jgi:hypothetical protein